MNTINATNTTIAPVLGRNAAPALTRKVGNRTYEVYVHFSKTSTETMTDKIMRLIRNDISSMDCRKD